MVVVLLMISQLESNRLRIKLKHLIQIMIKKNYKKDYQTKWWSYQSSLHRTGSEVELKEKKDRVDDVNLYN